MQHNDHEMQYRVHYLCLGLMIPGVILPPAPYCWLFFPFFFVCTYPEVTRLSHEFTSLLSAADVAHQFQYAVRVIGSNYAPTIERDEFLVSEKIKKECEL